jgi:hypothetical protein
MTPTKQESILIAICTSGENANLPELLSQLGDFRNNSSHQIRIIIVWNSSENVGFQIPIDIEVHRITARGYSNARNLALQQRRAEESVMFIDDDEIIKLKADKTPPPETNFLDIYLLAAAEFPSSIFVGPYLPVSLNGSKLLEDWKQIPEMEYGKIINFGSGGNLFLPAIIFKEQEVIFDTFYNFGGEDTKLVRNFARKGIVTRWIPSAILYEKTPAERYTHQWQNDRKLKNFLVNIMIELETYKFSPIRRILYAIRILIFINLAKGDGTGKQPTQGKRFILFLAIIQHDLLKLKMIATNGKYLE